MAEQGNELYAWVAEETPGVETLVGVGIRGMGDCIPLVTSRRELALAMAPVAKMHGQGHRCPVRLKRYTAQEIVEEHDGRSKT